jgi:hypothetical protein
MGIVYSSHIQSSCFTNAVSIKLYNIVFQMNSAVLMFHRTSLKNVRLLEVQWAAYLSQIHINIKYSYLQLYFHVTLVIVSKNISSKGNKSNLKQLRCTDRIKQN